MSFYKSFYNDVFLKCW